MMDFNAFDDEIRAAERNIALNRAEFDASVSGAAHQAREAARNVLTSPWFLVGAAGLGLLVGHLSFRTKVAAPADGSVAKKSMWGLAATAAFSLVQAHFGGPVGLAQWVMTKIAARRHGAIHNYGYGSVQHPLH
jgi:hypothetical protein